MGQHVEIGTKIGMLTLIESTSIRDGDRLRRRAVLRCDCGAVTEKCLYAWKSGRQQSCGCHGSATRSLRHRTHGMSNTPIYQSWVSMKQRTTPGNAACAGNYVNVRRDPRWDTFEGFLDNQPTTGRPHSRGMQLARFNDVGDYTPENTRWLTRSENASEMLARRKVRLDDGRFACDVARENGLAASTWAQRYYVMGMTLDESVGLPLMR